MKRVFLLLCLLCAICCFAACECTDNTSDWLVGANRKKHAKLTAEEVAVKHAFAFYFNLKIFAETLPPKSADKWAKKKLSKQEKKNFEFKKNVFLKTNPHRIVAELVSKDGDNAVVESTVYINNEFDEKIRLKMERQKKGWVVVSETVVKLAKGEDKELNKTYIWQ